MIRRRSEKPRRGMTVVAVLVCLVVVTLLGGCAARRWRSPSARATATRSAGFRPSGWSSRASSERGLASRPIATIPARPGRSSAADLGLRRAERRRPAHR